MATYAVIHNPYRRNAAQVPESPAWEIATNIRSGKRPTTAFGGWSITKSEEKIKPGDCLLFYRSGCSAGPAGGYFAIGRALPASDTECRKLREEWLQKWYGKPGKLGEAIAPGLAAYPARNWFKGKEEKTTHVNAEWDVVADPTRGWVFSKRIATARRPSGTLIPEGIAEEIYAERAEYFPDGKRARFNAKWDVVDCPQRGRIFIRRGI